MQDYTRLTSESYRWSMRTVVATVLALSCLLGLAARADGEQRRIPWLTFTEVTLDAKTHVLSRHDIFPDAWSLSPDHKRFAHVDYTCDGCPPSTQLMVADVRGPGDRLLIAAAHGIRYVAWSPNGKTIAFTSDALWLVNADGTNLRRVGESGIQPAWSPDSRKIAYLTSNGYEPVIAVLTLASRSVRELAVGQNFRWSPEGSRLAYEKVGGGSCTFQARIVDVSSGASRAVACGSIDSWSPDGRHISLIRYDRGPGSSLWNVPTRGGRPRRIAWDAFGALWSPDSRWIAFGRGHHYCSSKLWLVPASGGRARVLAAHSRIIGPLAWSRTGRKTLYEAELCSGQ